MATGLVSVVIPCFNAEKTIQGTIDSVLSQDYANLEIIVVDDGSTDESIKIVSSYSDALQVVSGPNRGASFARNRGTALARGEFIQYLDSDDLLADGTIQHRVEALVATCSDVAYTDWQKIRIEPESRIRYCDEITVSMESVDEDPQIACLTSFWAPPAAVLYRRSIVDAIGGWNETLPIIQDARFLFDAAYHDARFVHVLGIGAYYREGSPHSLSQRSEHDFVRDVLQNAGQIRALWEQNAGFSENRKRAIAGVYDYAARAMFKYDEENFMEVLRVLEELAPVNRLNYLNVANALRRMFGIRWAQRIMYILETIKMVFSKPG